jgi:RES domain-containing protein
VTIDVYRIGYNGGLTLAGLPYGSTLSSGRWHTNQPGVGLPVVYAASTRALAQLEKRVHCNHVQPIDQALIRLEIDAGATIQNAEAHLALRKDWRDDELYTQALGTKWAHSRAAVGLWVPSFVEPAEYNLVLNPQHPQYNTHIAIIIEKDPFEFDPRLIP